jgi:phosphonate transport system substrate-binding protein
MNDNLLLLGAVAYDPKVVTIWEGFKEWFQKQGLDFEYLLYSNYERQVEAHLAGHFHIAWNSPLAWVRAERMARAQGKRAEAIAMRDTDWDLTSIIVVSANSPIQSIADLKGKKIRCGAIDSPQATLLPLSHLRANGVAPGADCQIVLHDVLGGKHGDHIGGEQDPTVRSLLDLEGLKKWKPGRISGYRALERSVDELAFYDDYGNITVTDYRY